MLGRSVHDGFVHRQPQIAEATGGVGGGVTRGRPGDVQAKIGPGQRNLVIGQFLPATGGAG